MLRLLISGDILVAQGFPGLLSLPSLGVLTVSLPSDFIGSVFSDVESGYVTLVRFHDGHALSHRVPVGEDLSAVDRFVDEHKETLYYNIGISRENPGERIRGGKSSLQCATMLWADVDLPKEGSGKKYPTIEAVTSALDDMPLRYSILVNTGGGLHVYWLLNEPYEFNSIEDVEKFEQSLSKPWQSLLRVKLAKYGDFEIDSTHDATRMLRIPGSWHKNGSQCFIEEADYSTRYGREDFEPFVETVRVESLLPKYTPVFTGEIEGNLNQVKLDALLYNSPEFKKVWNRKKEYSSASEADASLARHGITANWDDTEIANLIVAYNQKYSPDRLGKLFRKEKEHGNYIGRTIAAIRSKIAQDRALLNFEDDFAGDAEYSPVSEMTKPRDQQESPGDSFDPDAPVSVPEPTSSDQRADYLKRLSQFLAIPIARWIQVGREEPIYTLVLATGQQIKIGGEAAVVDSPRVFARRLYSELHVPMRPVTKNEWFTVCKFLGAVVELVDSPEVTTREIAVSGVMQFIEQQPVARETARDEAIRRGAAWYDGDWLHIYVQTVIRYINLHGGGKKWTNGEFVNAIRQAGFEQYPAKYKVDGVQSTKSYWKAKAEPYKEILDARRK